MPVSQRAGIRKGTPLYPQPNSRYLTAGAPVFFKDGGETVLLLPSAAIREDCAYSPHLLKRRIWLHPETSHPFVFVSGFFFPLEYAGSVISRHHDLCYSPGHVSNITY